jgi:hypothetical protein
MYLDVKHRYAAVIACTVLINFPVNFGLLVDAICVYCQNADFADHYAASPSIHDHHSSRTHPWR